MLHLHICKNCSTFVASLIASDCSERCETAKFTNFNIKIYTT